MRVAGQHHLLVERKVEFGAHKDFTRQFSLQLYYGLRQRRQNLGRLFVSLVCGQSKKTPRFNSLLDVLLKELIVLVVVVLLLWFGLSHAVLEPGGSAVQMWGPNHVVVGAYQITHNCDCKIK